MRSWKRLKDAPLVSSPGQDEVSTGLWKVALLGCAGLRSLVSDLFCGCLRTSSFPSAWKTSVIVPLIKDEQKPRSMGNVRPISLQSCLGKLLNKVLAHRLGAIFASHPILNPAQRGFILGGSISKCIDELLDAWQWSRAGKHELYTLFYDIKQAYDSVQASVLTRALQRIRLPDAFVRLVHDSLSGLSSCVRTAYGYTAPFPVERSLRQGDPLAPLLFVILMDGLHDGLERNPFTGEQHGLQLQLHDGVSMAIPSLGYADDTSVLTNTLANLRAQNEWVHYFMAFNSLRLNHSKCELVGGSYDVHGALQPVDAAAVARAGIEIEGQAVMPLGPDHPIRYLGVHCSFNGSWKAQQSKSLGMVQLFMRAIAKFRVSLRQAVYMIRVFLLPKLELALHYVHEEGVGSWLKGLDRTIIGAIKHAVGSPLQLSHSAIASVLGFLLPSRLEAAIKVSELFFRLNSVGCRWGRLGRILTRQTLTSAVDAESVRHRGERGRSLLQRTGMACSPHAGLEAHPA